MAGVIMFGALALILIAAAASARDDEEEPIVDEGDLPDDAVEIPPILTVDPGDGFVVSPGIPELPELVEQTPDLPELPDEAREEQQEGFDERAIPNLNTPEGQVAAMLYESEAAGQVVQDVPMLNAWKRSVGVVGAPELYGRGTARSLIARGIVPPNPWDWKNAKEPDVYVAELQFKARQEPDRADLWLERAATVS